METLELPVTLPHPTFLDTHSLAVGTHLFQTTYKASHVPTSRGLLA